MRSPKGGHELRQLDGDAADIWSRGDAWVKLGATMKSTATELKAIGDSSVNKSMGTDKLGEMASDASGDLHDAGVRYHDTGTALRTYGDALDVAKGWLGRNMDEIIAAENSYNSAVTASESAQDKKDDLDTTWPWEDDPTEAQKTAAASAVTEAASTLTAAESTRDSLWTEFDHVFETWSDAYDDAVDGIQKAMDTAGNNDGFWEALDDFLDIIGWVIIVLTVIALIIGAPLFGLLGMVIFALTALVFAARLLQFAFGKATLNDVIWAGISLIPFGIGRALSKGAKLSTVIKGGRSVVTAAIRSDLPELALTRPSTWLSPARSLLAPVESWLALPKPGLLVNPFRALRLGGPEAKIATFLDTMSGSAWGRSPAVAKYIAETSELVPNAWEQAVNVTAFGGSIMSDWSEQAGLRFEWPGTGEEKAPVWTP